MSLSILDGFELREPAGCPECFRTGRCSDCEGEGNVPLHSPDGSMVLDYVPCKACSGSSYCPSCQTQRIEAYEAGYGT